jgi:uncharacterized DUF497 family protein
VQFAWDEAKAASNLRKHGVDFDDAMRIFLDPRRLIAEDQRFHYGERRLHVLGAIDGRILFVVCTWRGGVCRLISARKANARERRRYEASDS